MLFQESGLPSYLPFYEVAIDLKTCKGGMFRKQPDAGHKLQIASNLYACTDFSFKKEWMSIALAILFIAGGVLINVQMLWFLLMMFATYKYITSKEY